MAGLREEEIRNQRQTARQDRTGQDQDQLSQSAGSVSSARPAAAAGAAG